MDDLSEVYYCKIIEDNGKALKLSRGKKNQFLKWVGIFEKSNCTG